MRAISLVNKIEFNFVGNVARNALTLGDVDNDGCNELVIANTQGVVAIFKGREKIQTITDLGFVVCVAIGDIFNKNKNSLVIVAADGWCFIYEATEDETSTEQVDGQVTSVESLETSGDSTSSKKSTKKKQKLSRIYDQRLPANAKDIVLGDIDGDGQTEMILGLTDRVVRSYRWFCDKDGGKLVALNKWECANQIGSITIHHGVDDKPSLLIAQPGGTFMRIRYEPDGQPKDEENSEINDENGSVLGSTVDYQFLGISRMRSQNISTEILGDFRTNKADKRRPYAVATLDGTIMLVQDEVILWAIAVDHQIFALTKMDVTGNGADDIVVCSWDGQTYILDQEKNSVRVQLDEPVQAFCSGYYNLSKNEPAVTSLVYVTFKNTVIIYYDIPLKELVIRKFDPKNTELEKHFPDLDDKSKRELVEFLLYNVKL